MKRLINGALQNTTVTVVLIGTETYYRRWVRYEIMKSMARGNKIIGIHINWIKGKDEKTKPLGPNPFKYLGYKYSDDGKRLYLYEYKTGGWRKYDDLDDYTLASQAPKTDWGKFYQLSSSYLIYNWTTDNGYNNFSEWIG